MATTWLGGRFEASRRTLLLALGDVAMIALFVFIGEIRHAGSLSGGARTFGQFVVGWLLVSIVAGMYGPRAIDGPRRAVVQVVAAWVLAAVIGQLVRTMTTPGDFVHLSFVLVSISFGGAFLGAWRYVAARAVTTRDTPMTRP